MFSLKADLQGIEETVTRPMLISIVEDIKKLLGLKHEVFTVFNVKDNIVKQKTATGNVIGKNTVNSDKISIEYEEDTEDVSGKRLTSARPDFAYIYNDKEVGAYVMPIYHSRKMNISFTYSNKSKSKIFSIANKLKLYTSSDGYDQLHDIEYSYIIPNFVNKLLIEINKLKNSREEDVTNRLTLEQYIDKHFDDRVDFANTVDGDIAKTELNIREAQTDIEGYITDDVDGIKPEYDDSTGYWNIIFNYEYVYEKPVSLLLHYPLLVYNHVIDKFFRAFHDEKPKYTKNAIRTGRVRELYNIIDREQDPNDPLTLKHREQYLKIPEQDKINLPTINRVFLKLCSILIQVDDQDKKSLFNINDIPGLKLKRSYRDFMIRARDYISKECECMFYFELWKNGEKDYHNKVVLDEQGNLTSSYEMDIKNTYRVTISILMDPDLLSARGKKMLSAFSKEQELHPEFNTPTSVKMFGKYYQRLNYQHMKNIMENQYYWNSSNYLRFKKQIDSGSIILDWLTIREMDPRVVNDIVAKSAKFDDILDYTLASRINNAMYTINNNPYILKTVQVTSALSLVFENNKQGDQHG